MAAEALTPAKAWQQGFALNLHLTKKRPRTLAKGRSATTGATLENKNEHEEPPVQVEGVTWRQASGMCGRGDGQGSAAK